MWIIVLIVVGLFLLLLGELLSEGPPRGYRPKPISTKDIPKPPKGPGGGSK